MLSENTEEVGTHSVGILLVFEYSIGYTTVYFIIIYEKYNVVLIFCALPKHFTIPIGFIE